MRDLYGGEGILKAYVRLLWGGKDNVEDVLAGWERFDGGGDSRGPFPQIHLSCLLSFGLLRSPAAAPPDGERTS